MSKENNTFTIAEALRRADSIILDRYEVDGYNIEVVDGRETITFDLSLFDQPDRTFDTSQSAELVHGEADFTDIEGNTARLYFSESIPLANTTRTQAPNVG